jgi:hypothetical protein
MKDTQTPAKANFPFSFFKLAQQNKTVTIMKEKTRKQATDLISFLCSSKTRKVQIDLYGKKLEGNQWKILGFIDASFLKSLGVDGLERWTIRLMPKEMDEIYLKWDKIS